LRWKNTDEKDIRRRGYSKDHRPGLPQVVVGLAVTQEGIPVKSWTWPGNTQDMDVIREVKRDLAGWMPGRVISVMDRGFCSEERGFPFRYGILDQMAPGPARSLKGLPNTLWA
jgi:hypothetical protein